MAENTLRSNLEAAFDAQQKAPEPSTPDVAPKVAIATEAKPEPIGQKVDTKARDPRTGQYLEAAKKPEAPKKADVAPAVSDSAKAGEVATESPPVTASPAEVVKPARKLPQDMSASARELAAKLPAEFSPLLDEWEKRHKETSRVLSETAQDRQFAQATRQSLLEYAPIARANGMDPMTWAGNALQTVAALYAGSPQQKAAVIAQAIALAGVDVESINQAMANPNVQQPRQPQQPQFDPTRIKQDIINDLRSESATHKARAFIESGPEFLQDVWPDMVAILKASEDRGQPMDYAEAHQRAIWANPEIRAIVQQREAAKSATVQNAATQRAAEAASSIRSNPSGAPSSAPKGLRAILEAEYDKQRR